MAANAFIFSNKPAHRLARHLSFWLSYCLYTFLDHFSAYGYNNFFESFFYQNVLEEIVIFFPVYFFSVYTMLYFVFPKYVLPKKTGLLILSVLCINIICLVAYCFIYDLFFIPHNNQPQRLLDIITQAEQTNGKQIIVTGIALIIKLVKYYYLKRKEYEQLIIENAKNKLQVMKSNLHPQIIFESLQRIEKDIDGGTHYAPEMILLLSDLLSYLLYKADQDEVLLSEEIKMMYDFTKLKNIGYINQAPVSFITNVEDNTYIVPPLIFLPLLETALKVADSTTNTTFVFAELILHNSTLHFSIECNVSNKTTTSNSTKYVIENIRKRLEIIFPGEHTVIISPASEKFYVKLELELKNINNKPFAQII